MKGCLAYWLTLLVSVTAGILNIGAFWVIRAEGQIYPRVTPIIAWVEVVLAVLYLVVSWRIWMKREWNAGVVLNLAISCMFLFFLAVVFAAQWYFYSGKL